MREIEKERVRERNERKRQRERETCIKEKLFSVYWAFLDCDPQAHNA